MDSGIYVLIKRVLIRGVIDRRVIGRMVIDRRVLIRGMNDEMILLCLLMLLKFLDHFLCGFSLRSASSSTFMLQAERAFQ
jgi:hypothetical protein